MRKHSIYLFVDFDGTITSRDVGSGLFRKFMRPDIPGHDSHEDLIRDWKAGLITSKECLSRECRSAVVTEPQLQAEIDTYRLTPGFPETAAFCRDRGIPVAILSDGMDYYIRRLLETNGLAEVPFFANHLWFQNGGVACDFPWIEKGCGKCGNCKRYHMNRLARPGDHVIYAGDGYSDRYAILNADTVFARGDLAGYCRETGRPFLPFEDFFTVLEFIERLHGTL